MNNQVICIYEHLKCTYTQTHIQRNSNLFSDAQPNGTRLMSLFACTRMIVRGNSIQIKIQMKIRIDAVCMFTIWLQFANSFRFCIVQCGMVGLCVM